MSKSIYVAGASAEVHMVRGYMQKLREAGFIITHDWTESVVAAQEAGRTDRDLSLNQMSAFACHDLYDGVSVANWVWLLIPEKPSLGCWVEFGFALGERRKTIVSGDVSRSIFCSMANTRYTSHDLALQALTGSA